MVPIDQHVITGVVFHRYEGSDAVSLSPVGHQRNAGLLDAHVERRVRR